MKWIICYDAFCYRCVEALLKWLDEWLSISQKRAEQGMIVLYVVLGIIVPGGRYATFLQMAGTICEKIPIVAFVACMMWLLHRRPAVIRRISYGSRATAIGRFIVQMMMLLAAFIVIFFSPHRWTDGAVAFSQVEYIVFFYAVDITSDGERGRRRRLALAELKKMFGTEWIPKPVPVPR
jgi:hypothetical protein